MMAIDDGQPVVFVKRGNDFCESFVLPSPGGRPGGGTRLPGRLFLFGRREQQGRIFVLAAEIMQ